MRAGGRAIAPVHRVAAVAGASNSTAGEAINRPWHTRRRSRQNRGTPAPVKLAFQPDPGRPTLVPGDAFEEGVNKADQEEGCGVTADGTARSAMPPR